MIIDDWVSEIEAIHQDISRLYQRMLDRKSTIKRSCAIRHKSWLLEMLEDQLAELECICLRMTELTGITIDPVTNEKQRHDDQNYNKARGSIASAQRALREG
jgi:hypothetical protein